MKKGMQRHSSFFSFLAVVFVLILFVSSQRTLTGRAVFVLDEDVTADQIAIIATLAGSGDETKMSSEVSLDNGEGYIVFSGLDDGDSATIKESNGNIYVKGNLEDAVAVIKSSDYKELLDTYEGVLEIVNGEIVVEEEEIVQDVEEETEEVVEEEIEEETEEVVEEKVEEEPTGPYCMQTENGVKGRSRSAGVFSYENSCGSYDTREYVTIYSCGSYDRGSRWGGIDYFWQTGQQFCRYGCDDGACKQADDVLEFSDSCIDSDQGDAFDKVGAVTFNGEVYEDTCAEDFDFVYEYSCSLSGALRKVKQQCQYRCDTFTNGNCYGGYTKGSSTVLISGEEACQDTDAGDLYDGVGRSGTVTLNGESYADSCEQGKSLIEYSCVDGKELGKRRYTCAYTCADGACPQSYTQGSGEVLLPAPEEPKKGDCQTTTTGVTGTNARGYTITYENDCSPYTTGIGAYETYYVNVAYCDENNYPALSISDCPEGSICSADGTSCVEGEASCEDSDNGIDASISGTVQYLTASGGNGIKYDECMGDKILTEWYCDGNKAQSETIQCNEYCYGTVCDTMSLECSDTENGADASVAGSLTYYSLDGTTTSYEDTCFADGKSVTDWYCDGKDVKSQVFTCDGYCSYGSCTATEATLFTPITTVDEFVVSTQDWYYDMKIVIPSKGSTQDYLAALALVGKYGYPLIKDTAVSDYRTLHAIVVGGSSVNTVSKAAIDAGATKNGLYYVYQDPTYYGTLLIVGSDDPKETRKAVKELVKK